MRLHVRVPWPLHLLWLMFVIPIYVLIGIGWALVIGIRGTYRLCGLLRLALATLCIELAEDCDRMQARQDRRRAQHRR